MSAGIWPVRALAVLMLVALTGGTAAAQGQREVRVDGADAGAAPIRVVLPDPDNLQYLSFWIAVGAGYFEAEGLELQRSSPPFPNGVVELLRREGAPVAVLPPPIYLQLIAEQQPVRLVANLLTNDGINLIVRRSVMDERRLSPTAPLVERLRGLKGLKIGIAPGPVTRLRTLFSSQGLVADELIEIVVMPGADENDAFGKQKVDGLYAHTPYLEKALVDQGAAILVNQSAGEVLPLSGLQIHALVVTASFADEHPDQVLGLTRAVYRAQRLVHADPAGAAAAIVRALPSLEPRLVDALVPIYARAVPEGPQVSAARLLPALELFPARKSPPSLAAEDLGAYVAPRFAEQVVREGAARGAQASVASGQRRLWTIGGAAAAVVTVFAAATLLRRRRRRRA